ncbi:MAG TPA: methyl-accepting chemotaxis protein, partial [Burkholderiaceae bacterium]
MKNLSLKSRLVLLVGSLMALLVFSATFAVLRMRAGNESLGSLYQDRVVSTEQLKRVSDAYNAIVHAANKAADGALTPAAAAAKVRGAQAAIAENWRAYAGSDLDADERPLVQRAVAGMAPADAAAVHLLALLGQGQVDGVRALATRELYPSVEPVAEVVDQLARLQLDGAAREYARAQRLYTEVLWTTVVVASAVVVVATVLALGLVRSITSGIAEAVRVAQTVAEGDLGSRIEVTRHDEIGTLLGALKRMNANLVDVVGRVRDASESIATGSAQIAHGNADLSQRTEEQASNLQQTAASMEELSATVRQNADTARRATEIATRASGVAQQGGEVVGRVVATMDGISESSRRIGDIIGVIDGIAFQTNILALNAAVEAARAGEQGRGFAVVAGEVRGLAQRSANAAREIKALIGQSVEKVGDGARLVADAGRTMGEIVEQVRGVSTLISEISVASGEQSTGIGQVGNAVAQLDQVTQQNAALVEQSAAAAESLRAQADTLSKTVA